jgi:hypothetical protein
MNKKKKRVMKLTLMIIASLLIDKDLINLYLKNS